MRSFHDPPEIPCVLDCGCQSGDFDLLKERQLAELLERALDGKLKCFVHPILMQKNLADQTVRFLIGNVLPEQPGLVRSQVDLERFPVLRIRAGDRDPRVLVFPCLGSVTIVVLGAAKDVLQRCFALAQPRTELAQADVGLDEAESAKAVPVDGGRFTNHVLVPILAESAAHNAQFAGLPVVLDQFDSVSFLVKTQVVFQGLPVP
jgi:hypothetical protein